MGQAFHFWLNGSKSIYFPDSVSIHYEIDIMGYRVSSGVVRFDPADPVFGGFVANRNHRDRLHLVGDLREAVDQRCKDLIIQAFIGFIKRTTSVFFTIRASTGSNTAP